MATLYFGFGIADGMFNGDVQLNRRDLGDDGGFADYYLRNPNAAWCQKLVVCLNPSHKSTIDAMVSKYGIENIQIPTHAPVVKLEDGDALLVMSPRGLPRLVDRHEYTAEEISSATFNFALWTVSK